MKKYSIPIVWLSTIKIEVEAENLKEAIEKSFEKFYSISDEFYIEDSAYVDEIIYEDYPEESDLI